MNSAKFSGDEDAAAKENGEKIMLNEKNSRLEREEVDEIPTKSVKEDGLKKFEDGEEKKPDAELDDETVEKNAKEEVKSTANVKEEGEEEKKVEEVEEPKNMKEEEKPKKKATKEKEEKEEETPK